MMNFEAIRTELVAKHARELDALSVLEGALWENVTTPGSVAEVKRDGDNVNRKERKERKGKRKYTRRPRAGLVPPEIVPAAGPATKAPRMGAPGSFALPRQNGGSLAEKIRTVLRSWDPGRVFLGSDMEAELKKTDENWTSKKQSLMRINMLDMVSRGELTKKGFGTMAEFRIGRLKPAKAAGPTEKELAWQKERGDIQVPRDAEVEGS